MSKKPIFPDGRSAGRKANLLTSMVKKTESSLLNLEKNESSPFFGHSFSSSSLAQSQVTTGFNLPSNGNLDSLKLIVQEEVQKSMAKVLNERLSKTFSDRDKQIQLMNEDIQKLNKNIEGVIKTYEEKNRELFNTFENARIQHDEMTLQNLKIFIGIMKEELTKEFVPMRLLEELELERQMESYEDRIQALERMPRGLPQKRQHGEEVTITKELDITVNKVLREIEGLKKGITTLTEEKNSIQSDVLTINKSLVDINMKNDQQTSKIDVIVKQTNQELTTQLARVREQMDDNTQKLFKNIEELRAVPHLSSFRSTESKNQKTDEFKLDDMTVNISTTLPDVNTAFSPDRSDTTKPTSPEPLRAPQSSTSPPNPNQHLYQIDSEGLLMDQHGQYILDSEGNFIVLTQQQIKALRESNMLIE